MENKWCSHEDTENVWDNVYSQWTESTSMLITTTLYFMLVQQWLFFKAQEWLCQHKYLRASNESTWALIKLSNTPSVNVTLYMWVVAHFGWILIFCGVFFFSFFFSLHEANILLLLELQVLQHTWHKYTLLNNKHQPCFLLVWYLCTVSKKTELSIGESVSLPLPHSRNTQYYRLYPQSKQTNKATINSHSNRNQLLPFNFQKPVFSMCFSHAESCN